MGTYLDPGNQGFSRIANKEYVDKTGLISFINQKIGSSNNLICISRPRRFGKSYAAKMLCAYYDKSCDSHELFRNYAIAKASDYESHINHYHVISLDISEGEIVALLGPNGAGKSTTIKILSGILYPDSGIVECNGFVPYKERMRYTREIGVVFGQRTQLFWDVPVADSFQLLKDIYDISEQTFQENQQELTELLNLQELLRTPVRQLSLGQRMRCEIAGSLLHSPKILFLDEPTIGLDACRTAVYQQAE